MFFKRYKLYYIIHYIVTSVILGFTISTFIIKKSLVFWSKTDLLQRYDITSISPKRCLFTDFTLDRRTVRRCHETAFA